MTSLVSGREFWQKGLDSKKIAKSGKLTHHIVDNESTIRKGVSNDSDVVINVGRTSGGHSSRSYFEADMINRRSEFISGKRISLDGTGYQDKKITTVKSVEKVGETAVYSKRGDDIIKSTTVSMQDPDTGQITKNTLDEVFKKDGAKSTVVVMSLEPSVRYEKDATRAKVGETITVAGTQGARTVTTTYTVNPTDGSLIPHKGTPVITPSTPTVVKVPAKDEVEYLKEGDNIVKKATTYAVNASTGTLTPTVRKDIVNPNGVKSKVVTKIIPVTTRYEADKTKDVGTNTVTNNGSEGKIVTITPKLVNETNGIVTDGTPVVSKTEMVPKVVRVGAKDKVVEISVEPEVEYVRDGEREVDIPNERVEGAKGKTVTTTTYDVNPNDGHITEHVGNPVVTPAGKTIVKVGAKTKVERNKDDQGRDVIDTTTYEVDSKTGKVTPTTVRTYGTSKETKIELEQSPKAGDVTVTPKKPDDSTSPSGTKVEMPGEDERGKVPNSDFPEGKLSGTGKITEPGKAAVRVPNVTTPAKVIIFENGVLADSIKLPELMIEVLWNDEDGNVLKPSVKTGNEKDAEHGLIPGYEFVRTMIDENEPVMTHIFRKVGSNTNTIPVAPVTPATNGGSGQDIPASTTPNAVNSNADQVDTQTTIDSGAKSNDSQNVLPNTGTESNATLASLGLLGMLRGLGLALGKKKED